MKALKKKKKKKLQPKSEEKKSKQLFENIQIEKFLNNLLMVNI